MRLLLSASVAVGMVLAILARPKLKGRARQGFAFTFIMAAYDLVRLPRLIAAAA